MIAGIPVGRQLAASVSSKLRASSSRFFAAYAGVSCGTGGGAAAGPRPPRPTVGASHTPVRSGSFASAAQSAAEAAFDFDSCPATEIVAAATSSRTMRVACFMVVDHRALYVLANPFRELVTVKVPSADTAAVMVYA